MNLIPPAFPFGMPIPIDLKTGKPFLTGAKPSPRHKLLAATPFKIVAAYPPQCIYAPKTLRALGNNQYGDCVSAEEGFAKQCLGLDGQGNVLSPELDITDQLVIDWARKHGYLNGADLSSVMDDMIKHGFQLGSQLYNDGPYSAVDYSNEGILQAAIAVGVVKIAIAASVLASGAGNHSGWYVFGNHGGRNTDHCVALCGYGPISWLCSQLGIPVPSGVDPNKIVYALYTWATIGFVDHDWLMGTCAEAWVRNPTTVGVPPLPPINPPVITPPVITSVNTVTFKQGIASSFTITATGNPIPSISMSGCNCFGITCTDNKNGTATLTSLASSPPGNYTFQLTASNGTDPKDTITQDFNLVIGQPVPIPTNPPQFTSANSCTFVVGLQNSFTVSVDDKSAQLITVGFPAGASFIDNKNGTATITGNLVPGSYSFVIVAFNSKGSTQQPFTLTVTNTPPPPPSKNILEIGEAIPVGTYLVKDSNGNPVATLMTNSGIPLGKYSV